MICMCHLQHKTINHRHIYFYCKFKNTFLEKLLLKINVTCSGGFDGQPGSILYLSFICSLVQQIFLPSRKFSFSETWIANVKSRLSLDQIFCYLKKLCVSQVLSTSFKFRSAGNWRNRLSLYKK